MYIYICTVGAVVDRFADGGAGRKEKRSAQYRCVAPPPLALVSLSLVTLASFDVFRTRH